MPKCLKCFKAEIAYDDLCQTCLNKRKKVVAESDIPDEAVMWTPAALKLQFSQILTPKEQDSGENYYVNKKKGAHIHTYGNAAHVKVGGAQYRFIEKDGRFNRMAWLAAIADISNRGMTAEGKQLLACMALILAKRGGGLSSTEAGALIAALPIPN